MNNKKKINEKIEELKENKGFIDTVNIGLFHSQGINLDSDQMKTSVINYNKETYKNLEIINLLFDTVKSLNQIIDLFYNNSDELGSNQYKEVLYSSIYDDIFKRMNKVFKFN